MLRWNRSDRSADDFRNTLELLQTTNVENPTEEEFSESYVVAAFQYLLYKKRPPNLFGEVR